MKTYLLLDELNMTLLKDENGKTLTFKNWSEAEETASKTLNLWSVMEVELGNKKL